MESIIKEIKSEEKAAVKSMKKLNIWMIVSAVLAVALVIVALVMMKGGVSEKKAGETLLAILNERTGGGVTLNNIKDSGSLYEATVSYKGQEIPVYITKKGDYVVYQAEKIGGDAGNASASADSGAQADTPAEVPKSDKPVVEAFVFTYCPYGLQFEKAFLPAYSLLKEKADMKIVFIGAMHGEYEKVESLRQLCVQKEYGEDKLMAYLEKFVVDTEIGSCGNNMNCSKPLAEKIMEDLSVDADKINSCMEDDAEELYAADEARASELGISGSPTFVINGVEVQVGRTPDAIKTAVCGAFNTAPSECSQNLSASSMTAGFGASAGASTGASCG